jgi:hypothetical protein
MQCNVNCVPNIPIDPAVGARLLCSLRAHEPPSAIALRANFHDGLTAPSMINRNNCMKVIAGPEELMDTRRINSERSPVRGHGGLSFIGVWIERRGVHVGVCHGIFSRVVVLN